MTEQLTMGLVLKIPCRLGRSERCENGSSVSELEMYRGVFVVPCREVGTVGASCGGGCSMGREGACFSVPLPLVFGMLLNGAILATLRYGQA